MKYRIVKHLTFNGEMFAIEVEDGMAWRYVSDSMSSTIAQVEQKVEYLRTHGEPSVEVVREIEV